MDYELSHQQWHELLGLPIFDYRTKDLRSAEIIANGCFCDRGYLVETWTLRVSREIESWLDYRFNSWKLFNLRGGDPASFDFNEAEEEAKIMNEAYLDEMKGVICDCIGLDYGSGKIKVKQLTSDLFALVKIEEIKEAE